MSALGCMILEEGSFHTTLIGTGQPLLLTYQQMKNQRRSRHLLLTLGMALALSITHWTNLMKTL